MLLETLQSPSAVRLALAYPVTSVLVGLFLYGIGLAVYRVTLHPAAKFPGPKLAAISYWYEFYHDVWRGGQYLFKIMELHEKYGPIVRVNPNDVHIKDSGFFREIYHSKNIRTDREPFYNLNFLGEGVPFTPDHDVHHARRQALHPFFSMQAIRQFETRISDTVVEALVKLDDAYKTGAIVEPRLFFAAITTDIITRYSFGVPMGLVENDEACKSWANMSDVGPRQTNLFRQFPWFAKTIMKLPEEWVAKVSPDMDEFVRWSNQLRMQVKDVIDRRQTNPELKLDQKTVLHDILGSTAISEDDKQVARMMDEARLLIAAGAETTGMTLTRLTVHLLSNPDILSRLQAALDEAIPDVNEFPSLAKVQQIPYLMAVCEEGIRIATPVLSRSPRVFKDHDLEYNEWTIPAGVGVSQSPWVVMTDPEIFPEPHKFNPDRWVNNPGLSKYQVAFSKGRRACVGINLAYSEINLLAALVFRRYELELYETTVDDIKIHSEHVVGMTKRGQRAVKVLIKGLRK